MSLSKHTKVDDVQSAHDTLLLNIFIPDRGMPQECAILVVDLLEIDDLLTVCQVSKYMHTCVRASTKNASMAVKCALKWLRINSAIVAKPHTFEAVLTLAKTQSIFPLTLSEKVVMTMIIDNNTPTPRYHDPDFRCRVHYGVTPTDHPGILSPCPWGNYLSSRREDQILPLIKTPSLLKAYFHAYLNETVFTVRPARKCSHGDLHPPYDILPGFLFEYNNETHTNAWVIKKPRADKDRYRLAIGTITYCKPSDGGDYVSHHRHLVTGFIFELEDIIETGKVWKLLTDPEWLKTRPLKFERDWWSEPKEKEEEKVAVVEEEEPNLK